MITDLEIPVANPIRVRPTIINGSNVFIDYDNYLPQMDLMEMNEQYQAGIFVSDPEFYPPWKSSEEIAFQLRGDFTSSLGIIYGPGIATAMTASYITPSGWAGFPIRKFRYTPTVIGFYYVRFIVSTTSNTYELFSDVFYVSSIDNKDIIEIKFFSDENKNGFIFDQYYKAYYYGMFKKIPQERNSSLIQEDIIKLLASKSYNKLSVTISDIHHTYYDKIAKQLENEDIMLNGISYICKEPPSEEYIGKSDLVNIIFELTAKYDNNFMIIS